VFHITSGYRLTLVYNLRRQGRGQLPTPPNYDTEQAHVTALLRQWSAGKDTPDDDSPEKLLYPLEHAYTPAELAFETLKGADAAAAACDLHLALVSIKESGSADMEDELCPPDAFADLEPDEQYFHEATGNEGAPPRLRRRRGASLTAPLPSSTHTAGRLWCCGRRRGGRLSSTRPAWRSPCPTWTP
jgi:hypothetical protein